VELTGENYHVIQIKFKFVLEKCPHDH